MKLIAAIILTAMLACLTVNDHAEEERVTVSPESEDIVYMGRWEKGEDGFMRGAFECGLVLRFTGTSIRVDGEASGTVLVAVDGGELQQKTLSRNTRVLRNLPDGEHTLEMYAAAQQMLPAFKGFTLDPGAHTLPTERGKIIEFIGDSIMEGYVDPNDAIKGVVNSYMTSYAFRTGRELMNRYGMRFNTIAYGGIRIVGLGDNNTGNDPLGMPERYFLDREYRSNPTAEAERAAAHRWDTSKYAPDFIVINLGTNDTSATNSQVSAAMLSFLRELRGAYADAVIFVMTPFNGTKASALLEAVAGADDNNIILIDTASWNIKAGSDWLHPAPNEHVRAAGFLLEALTPYIEAAIAGPTEVPTDEPIDGSTAAPVDESAASPGADDADDSDNKVVHRGGSLSAVPFVIGGIVLAAAAAVVALISVRKKK
ncbi:MAG: hypothetical protein J5950_10480 [Clostridia bacterium]|nr:hypothetical protein [Clostridia bacterium]